LIGACSLLSVVILSAFTVLGLIVLPALAEIRSRRRDADEPPDSGDGPEDLPLAA
jgi:hypothetical protein